MIKNKIIQKCARFGVTGTVLFLVLLASESAFAATLNTPTNITSLGASFSAQPDATNNTLEVINVNRVTTTGTFSFINTGLQSFTITHLSSGTNQVSGTNFRIVATAGETVKIKLAGTSTEEKSYIVPSASATSGSQQIGQECGSQPLDCAPNLVCAPVEIDKKYMCRGNVDMPGCLAKFNSMPEDEKKQFGIVTSDDLCASQLVCSSVIDPVNGVCANDFGGKKAAELKLGEDTTDIRNEINRIINIFLSFLAIVGIILVIYGGVLWATASGNEEQVGKARKTIIAAVIGLIIIAVAWTIVSYVINLGDTLS
ncbi:MAG: hypothetical protein UW24_C0007G0030 [Parcubacteria group bacterium GW2011_GWA2_44_12]|nr:MAG: hypothetical protein UW24_C0007G0030 [Parcubacteria group bacterium GW2011_GWA2_44_12]